MKKIILLFIILAISVPIYALKSNAASDIKNEIGRYQIYEGFKMGGGGASVSAPILLDTATGKTWQYFLNTEPKEGQLGRGWQPLIFVD